MKFFTSVFSSAGGRENNEDNSGYIYKEDNYGAWVVADGLGGHFAGERASKIAVDTVLYAFEKNPDLSFKNIESILNMANNLILSEQAVEKQFSGMRTTIVGLFTNGREITWAHIGDSRFYWFRNGRLAAQTKDHSVSQMAASLKEISSEEIRFHEDRNKLLRVLGSGPDLKPEIHKHLEVASPGDAIMLCSDGFWEYVYEVEMEIDLAKAITADEWLRHMIGRVSKRVRGNHDNFTAMTIFIE